MNPSLVKLLDDLIATAPSIRKHFDDLFDPQISTIPIPFFGNILSARVVTVGLNPSDGELRGRGWPASIDAHALASRLLGYFSAATHPSHPWFGTWVEALDSLGASFSAGTAAHIDLCPWATRPASQLPKERFLALAGESFYSFARCLSLAEKARLILLAGSATKKYYLHEFIHAQPATAGVVITERPRRGGTAFTAFHELSFGNVRLPAFFCSVSPSSPNKAFLPQRVRESKQRLLTFLQ